MPRIQGWLGIDGGIRSLLGVFALNLSLRRNKLKKKKEFSRLKKIMYTKGLGGTGSKSTEFTQIVFLTILRNTGSFPFLDTKFISTEQGHNLVWSCPCFRGQDTHVLDRILLKLV